MAFLYRYCLRPLFFGLDAERAHHAGLRVARWIGSKRWIPRLLLPGRQKTQRLRVEALGLEFEHPVGLAAGFDKDATAFAGLHALGFAFVEVGTLTALAQPGNPRPRLFRLPQDRALINRMGFNNLGSAAAAPSLASPRTSIVGANIGKSKATPPQGAVDDYRESTRVLAPHADYLVINVSSPNTPGLRDLQSVGRLRPIVQAVRESIETVCISPIPLLIKIAPDLDDSDIDALTDLAIETGIDGIIATNTTIDRPASLRTPAQEVAACGEGGLSGAPLASRATQILRRIRRRAGSRLVLIASGGIETAHDVWSRIRAGASLVQIYTAFVYEGPSLPQRLARELDDIVSQSEFPSVEAAIGADVDALGL